MLYPVEMTSENLARLETRLCSRIEEMLGDGSSRQSSSHFMGEDLELELEPASSWEKGDSQIMAMYPRCKNFLCQLFGPPFYDGEGYAFLSSKDLEAKRRLSELDPQPYHPTVGYLCGWKKDTSTIYLKVTCHDADSLRCLNLEIIRKQEIES